MFLLGLYLYKPHIRISIYHEEPPAENLTGCFGRVSRLYNVSQRIYGPKRTQIQSGMSLRRGHDCYAFAGTIQSHAVPEPTFYHTYSKAVPLLLINSFLATQNLTNAILVLWSDQDSHYDDQTVLRYLSHLPDALSLRTLDIQELREEAPQHSLNHPDLLRLLVLWNFGGVWLENDTILTRDLAPLLHHEFVTQPDCTTKQDPGMMAHFHLQSPYVCEALSIPTLDWPKNLFQRLAKASIPPFATIPSCFVDGRACAPRLPEFSKQLGKQDEWVRDALAKIFAFRLGGDKAVPPKGWVKTLVLEKHERFLSRWNMGVGL